MFRGWIVLALGAGGCEAVVHERFVVTLPEEIALRYTAQAPGIVRTSSMSEDEGVLLCGEALPQPLKFEAVWAIGCAPEDAGSRVERTAWIEPMPTTWDAEAACALPRSRGDRVELERVPGADPEDTLAIAPNEGWPQGVGEGVWHGAVDHCGGSLRVEVELSGD